MIERCRWIPIRFLPRGAMCDFCQCRIPQRRPGQIGTVAWYSPTIRAYECLACRSEGFRAELVREAIARGEVLQ